MLSSPFSVCIECCFYMYLYITTYIQTCPAKITDCVECWTIHRMCNLCGFWPIDSRYNAHCTASVMEMDCHFVLAVALGMMG